MSVAFLQAQKKKVRVTLEFDVFEDFNAKDIDFEKVFDLEPAESVDAYVEDFSVWHIRIANGSKGWQIPLEPVYYIRYHTQPNSHDHHLTYFRWTSRHHKCIVW